MYTHRDDSNELRFTFLIASIRHNLILINNIQPIITPISEGLKKLHMYIVHMCDSDSHFCKFIVNLLYVPEIHMMKEK